MLWIFLDLNLMMLYVHAPSDVPNQYIVSPTAWNIFCHIIAHVYCIHVARRNKTDFVNKKEKTL